MLTSDPKDVPKGPLLPGQRWSLAPKREVALRLLRGEPIDAVSRELGVEIYRLKKCGTARSPAWTPA